MANNTNNNSNNNNHQPGTSAPGPQLNVTSGFQVQPPLTHYPNFNNSALYMQQLSAQGTGGVPMHATNHFHNHNILQGGFRGHPQTPAGAASGLQSKQNSPSENVKAWLANMEIPNHNPKLCEAIATMVFKDEHSDFQIRVKGRAIPVHKAIICPQSGYFQKACTIDMKEKECGYIDLVEEDAAVVSAVVCFLYTGTYTAEQAETPEGERVGPISFQILMYAAGEMYQIEPLKGYARTTLTSVVDAAKAPEAGEDFLNAVRLAEKVIAPYDKTMRVHMAHLAVEYLAKIGADKMHDFMDELPSFGKDVGKLWVSNLAMSKEYHSPGAGGSMLR